MVQHRWTQAGERTVGWIERQTGALVVGVEGVAGAVVRPGPDAPVREGDRLTLIGGVNELRHAVEVV